MAHDPPSCARSALLMPDKFRSSATAAELREAMERAARSTGWMASPCAIADGGEGLLEALGGEVRTATVTGPLGDPVNAEWRMLGEPDGSRTAVIEMARASGLDLVGENRPNDPMAATTRGTGELIDQAIAAGANLIIVGCGGSATTDGGRGALEALGDRLGRSDIRLQVACDVTTTFIDAANVFGPQKGASPEQVQRLSHELLETAERYRARYGVDVTHMPRAGAAGGLAGGLAVLGAELRSGVGLVADRLGLDGLIEASDLVITGEGRLDETSLTGKVVGELIVRCQHRRPLAIVVGQSLLSSHRLQRQDLRVISLADRFGEDRARSETLSLVELVTEELLIDAARTGHL